MKEKTNMTVVDSSPAEIIKTAIAGGADLDQLENLITLQERYEANQAKKEYNKAMAAFKANPPRIEKDRKVGYSTSKGKVGYTHASLGNVVEKITIGLSEHGLSASWRVKQNGEILVTCVITHVMGHSEETTLTANADESGSKNSIQALGSTITYLERYSLLSILGLATYEDNDGRVEAINEKIDEGKVKIISDLIASKSIDEKKFLNYMNVEKVEDILSKDYPKAKLSLETKKGAKNGNN